MMATVWSSLMFTIFPNDFESQSQPAIERTDCLSSAIQYVPLMSLSPMTAVRSTVLISLTFVVIFIFLMTSVLNHGCVLIFFLHSAQTSPIEIHSSSAHLLFTLVSFPSAPVNQFTLDLIHTSQHDSFFHYISS